MKIYKIQHVPTGLFYKPNTNAYNKTNLSKKGKLYQRKPSIYNEIQKERETIILVNKKQIKKYNLPYFEIYRQFYLKYKKEDFELIEYEITN